MVKTTVNKVEAPKEGIRVTFESASNSEVIEPQVFDKVPTPIQKSPGSA